MRGLVILGLLLVLLPACQNDPPRVDRRTGLRNDLPAPGYHQPSGWWRANHGALVDGPWERRLWAQPTFQWQECALCHRLENSCQACHSYLGRSEWKAPKDPGEMEM